MLTKRDRTRNDVYVTVGIVNSRRFTISAPSSSKPRIPVNVRTIHVCPSVEINKKINKKIKKKKDFPNRNIGLCGTYSLRRWCRRINNVSVQMVCSECAVALTRINVPFAIYIVYSTVYVTTQHAGYVRNNTLLHTRAISTEYICKYSDQTRGMEYVFENKHTWRKHMINSGLYFVGFV